MIKPTPEEAKWIRRLERVMKDMPDSLWLFNNGNMAVLRKGPEGHSMLTHEGEGTVDQDYILADITCDSGGGGW